MDAIIFGLELYSSLVLPDCRNLRFGTSIHSQDKKEPGYFFVIRRVLNLIIL